MVAKINLIALITVVCLLTACGKGGGDGNVDVSVSNAFKNDAGGSRVDGSRLTEEEAIFVRDIEKGRGSERLSGIPNISGAGQGGYENKEIESEEDREKIIELYVADLGGVDLSFIGKMELCGNGKCYGVNLSREVNGSRENGDGVASLIGRIVLPRDSDPRDLDKKRVLQIDEVRLQSKTKKGGDGIWQALNLSRPIRIFGPVPGARVLVGISHKSSCQDDGCLVLDSVDSVLTPVHNEGQYLFYNPKIAVDKELPSGVHVYLPRGMTDGVQIVVANVMYSPDAEKHPTVTFSIHGHVKRPAVVTVRGMGGKNKNSNFPGDRKGYSVRVYGPGKVVDGKFEASRGIKKNSEGGILKKDADSMAICLNSISSPERQAAISSDLEQMGVSVLTDCVSIPPYVHMVLVEGGRGDMKFDVAFRSDPDSRYGNKIVLSPVNSFPGFKVVVNGFTWKGDLGDLRGGFGFAKGYAMGFDVSGRLGRTVLGSNLSSGGSVSFCQKGDFSRICETTASQDTPKRTLSISGDFRSMWWQTNSHVIENWYSAVSVISSSTSIINEGVCSSDGNVDRWTAFGSRPSGRSLFVSSTNVGRTSAVDLCRVFQVFGINNAIRLDGGSAASMAIDGRLVNDFNELDNPLEWLVFGSSRRVAYGFGVGINGVVGTQ